MFKEILLFVINNIMTMKLSKVNKIKKVIYF